MAALTEQVGLPLARALHHLVQKDERGKSLILLLRRALPLLTAALALFELRRRWGSTSLRRIGSRGDFALVSDVPMSARGPGGPCLAATPSPTAALAPAPTAASPPTSTAPGSSTAAAAGAPAAGAPGASSAIAAGTGAGDGAGAGAGAVAASPTSSPPVGRSESTAALAAAEADRRSAATTQTMLRIIVGPDHADAALKQLAMVVLVSTLGCAATVRKVTILSELFVAQTSPGGARASGWLRKFVEFVLLTFSNTLCSSSLAYLQAGIAHKWRLRVTQRMHEAYFARSAYFWIQQQTAEGRFVDPDLRIARDVREMANAAAEFAVSLTDASVKVLIFTAASAMSRRWVWTLSAPMFFFLTVKVILRARPSDGSNVMAYFQRAEGKFREQLLRLQNETKSICMLQGEAFESDALLRSVRDICHYWKQRYDLLFFMNLSESISFRMPQSATLLELVAFATAAWTGMARSPGTQSGMRRKTAAGLVSIQVRDAQSFVNACAGWSALLAVRTQIITCSYTSNRVQQLYTRLEQMQALFSKGRRRRATRERKFSNDPYFEVGNQPDVFVDGGPGVLAFDGVLVQTPSKVAVLRDLSFRVTEGQSYLIYGPAGSGKTAIARSLCSLWPVGSGQIARPGGAGPANGELAAMRGEVMYLPRDPCNPIGTLSDMLTYPTKLPAGLPAEELRRWFKLVDLETLVDDEVRNIQNGDISANGSARPVDWDSRLSLLDRQAFAFVRLLYHRPRFAILDECTSAMDTASERRLVEAAQELGITCITLARKPALRSIHSHVMRLRGELAEGTRGWEIVESRSRPPRDARLRKPRCASTHEAQARIEAYLSMQTAAPHDAASPMHEASSLASSPKSPRTLGGRSMSEEAEGPHHEMAQANEMTSKRARDLVMRTWPSIWSRLREALRIGLQKQRHAGRRMCTISVLLFMRTWLHWCFCRSLAGLTYGAVCRDTLAVLLEVAVGTILVWVNGYADQMLRYQAGMLAADVWAGLFSHLQRSLVKEPTLFDTLHPSDHRFPHLREDSLARLSEVRSMLEALSLSLSDSLMHIATVVWLLPELIRGMGTASMIPFAAQGLLGWICWRFSTKLEAAKSRTASLERSFEAAHRRLRLKAEEVAFSAGGATEKGVVESRFAVLMDQAESALLPQFFYKAFSTFVNDHRQLPACILRFLLFRYAQQNRPSQSQVYLRNNMAVPVGDIVSSLLLERAIQAPQLLFQQLVNSIEKFERMNTLVLRYLEVVAVCDHVSKRRVTFSKTVSFVPHGSPRSRSPRHRDLQASLLERCHSGPTNDSRPVSIGSNSVEVRNLDLRKGAPEGDLLVLADALTFDVSPEEPLLITGPSESGKSLLGRMLLGLVSPPGESILEIAGGSDRARPPIQQMMAVPQVPYFPLGGRLIQQIAYPCILRWPSRPPFEVVVSNGSQNRRPLTQEMIFEHFRPLGATSIVFNTERTGSINATLSFSTLNEVLAVLARPQDRMVLGSELECELADFQSSMGVSYSQQSNPPRSQNQTHPPSQPASSPRRHASFQLPIHRQSSLQPSSEFHAVANFARLRRSLQRVGLESLLLAEQEGWFARRNWEELTIGDQQRLCLARLLYHSPSIALLDDCTSALPEAEETIFHSEVLVNAGITTLTMCRQSFAPDYYCREVKLQVQDSPTLWLLLDRRIEPVSAAPVVQAEARREEEAVARMARVEEMNRRPQLLEADEERDGFTGDRDASDAEDNGDRASAQLAKVKEEEE